MKPKSKMSVSSKQRTVAVAKKRAMSVKDSSLPARLRAVEVEWMRKHPEKLRAYAGQYIVVEGTRIVAHGADAGRVVRAARRRGVTIPFILFLEKPDPDMIYVGA